MGAAVEEEPSEPLLDDNPADSLTTSKKRKLDDVGPGIRPCSSEYRGVSWHNQTRKWKAQIKVQGKDVNLGRHVSEGAAAKAYDRAAICARGKDAAKLNFNLSDYESELELLGSETVALLAPILRGQEKRMQLQTSRYHGVRQNKRSHKWESYIRVAGKHVHLGCHQHEVAAAQAFDQAVMLRHVHCSDADSSSPLVTNFPPKYYQGLLQQVLGGKQEVVVTSGKRSPATTHAFSSLRTSMCTNCYSDARSISHLESSAAPLAAPDPPGNLSQAYPPIRKTKRRLS